MNGWNYFNYFTEIEQYFWKKRGAHLLVSPLDWAIMEAWQKAGVPLEAVLKGIDRAFESYGRSRRGGSGKALKSLAYCTDAVLEAAEEQLESSVGAQPASQLSSVSARPQTAQKARGESFSREELKKYFERNIIQLKRVAEKNQGVHAELGKGLAELVKSLQGAATLLETPATLDLEDLERRLTIQDEKLHALLAGHAPEELLLKIRRELDGQLAAHRRKMKAEQLALIEKQYQQKRLLEEFGLPRLSLFYFSY